MAKSNGSRNNQIEIFNSKYGPVSSTSQLEVA
jgi:hypothetical protein